MWCDVMWGNRLWYGCGRALLTWCDVIWFWFAWYGLDMVWCEVISVWCVWCICDAVWYGCNVTKVMWRDIAVMWRWVKHNLSTEVSKHQRDTKIVNLIPHMRWHWCDLRGMGKMCVIWMWWSLKVMWRDVGVICRYGCAMCLVQTWYGVIWMWCNDKVM